MFRIESIKSEVRAESTLKDIDKSESKSLERERLNIGVGSDRDRQIIPHTINDPDSWTN